MLFDILKLGTESLAPFRSESQGKDTAAVPDPPNRDVVNLIYGFPPWDCCTTPHVLSYGKCVCRVRIPWAASDSGVAENPSCGLGENFPLLWNLVCIRKSGVPALWPHFPVLIKMQALVKVCIFLLNPFHFPASVSRGMDGSDRFWLLESSLAWSEMLLQPPVRVGELWNPNLAKADLWFIAGSGKELLNSKEDFLSLYWPKNLEVTLCKPIVTPAKLCWQLLRNYKHKWPFLQL